MFPDRAQTHPEDSTLCSIARCLAVIGLAVALPVTAQNDHDPQSGRPVTTPEFIRSRELAAQSAAWQAFSRENGPNWKASWNLATETPKAIYGVGMRVTAWPASAQAIAQSSWTLLNRYRGLLGAGDSTYQLAIAAEVNGVHVFVYDQYYRGLPVIGGRADVRINRGVLAMFGSQSLPIPAGFDTTPRIGSGRARVQAHLALGARPTGSVLDLNAPEPDRLVIWGDVHAQVRSPVYLAWEVVVNESGQGVVGRAYMDAITGRLLRYESDIHGLASLASHARESPVRNPEPGAGRAGPTTFSGNVQAWVNLGLGPLDPLQLAPLSNLRITVPGVGDVFTDANGDFSMNSSTTEPVDITVTLSRPSSGRHVNGVDAGQGTPVTQTLRVSPGVPAQFLLLSPNASEFDRAQTTAYWHLNDANEYLQGILSLTDREVLGRLDSIRATVNLPGSCDADYFNNSISFLASGSPCPNSAYSTIIYHEWGHGLDDVFGGISQAEGLTEAWSDIVAMYVTGQPIVGLDFVGPGTLLRTGLNTKQYPGIQCPVPHCRGETWMGFAWKLRERLRSELGTVAGTAHAERIVLGSIVANATNQPDALLEVFLLDDDDGNFLNLTPNWSSLVWAAEQHRLPLPYPTVVEIAHTPLGDTDLQFTPRIVRATATPVFGSAAMRVNVSTDESATPLTRAMVPSGEPDEYVALLPGYGSPSVVRYSIESGVNRLGSFMYQVGTGETSLRDDFEAGSAGWTHGLLAVEDDWQLGPAGRAKGTAGGQPWSDPVIAFSGLNIWGNDLALPGFDGAYGANVMNWLRSPTFSTVGVSGITLRFARWLTVDFQDKAAILVNGQEVWTNPSRLLDTAWSVQTIPIPEADDQSSVTIEWRLSTDGVTHFGGWNIDDVLVSSLGALPPPDIRYTLSPEQASIGSPMTMVAIGPRNLPALILLSSSPGPTEIPGIPPLSVGTNTAWVAGSFNPFGIISSIFNVPNRPDWVGKLLYSQVVALDGDTVIVSNPQIVLFAQ